MSTRKATMPIINKGALSPKARDMPIIAPVIMPGMAYTKIKTVKLFLYILNLKTDLFLDGAILDIVYNCTYYAAMHIESYPEKARR